MRISDWSSDVCSSDLLDAWGLIPGLRKLRVLGLALRANAAARAAHDELLNDAAFRAPLSYPAIDPAAFDALLLPGGHAQGMRPYLQDARSQAHVAAFFDADKLVAALCPGLVLAARSTLGRSGRALLPRHRPTARTEPLDQNA